MSQCEIGDSLTIGTDLLGHNVLLFCHLGDLLQACLDLLAEALLSSGDVVHPVEHHVNTFHDLVPLRLIIITLPRHVVE